MNGRIYDPKIARFLQADPFVQEPTNTQSLNRYSYTINNPLNATDPSGYEFTITSFVVKFIISTIILSVKNNIEYNRSRSPSIPKNAFKQLGLNSNSFGNGLFESLSNIFSAPGPSPILNIQTPNRTGQTAQKTIGQTYSDITGGKYSNGAVTLGNVDESDLEPSLLSKAFNFFMPNLKLCLDRLNECGQGNVLDDVSGALKTIVNDMKVLSSVLPIPRLLCSTGYDLYCATEIFEIEKDELFGAAVVDVAGYIGIFGAIKGAIKGTAKNVTKGSAEVVQRAMSRAELEAIQKSGTLSRGGRPGPHHVSDAVNSSANRARQRLALPQTPEVRATLEVPKGVFSSPSKVKPDFGMPGGGLERTAPGNLDIPARIIRADDL